MDTETRLRRARRMPLVLGAMSLLAGGAVSVEPLDSSPRLSRRNRSKYKPHVGKKQLRKMALRAAK